ncbi:hypothetical protein ACQPXB_36035 [Amycolatopsis sp. CA-161197]|uniref:hypothetical protein n=1 Tax=Amycolatopsis sp. CA-161197 TaxID=3239922 RepID=UPI003D89D081
MTDDFYGRAEQQWRGTNQRRDAVTGRVVPLSACDRVDIAQLAERMRVAAGAVRVERCERTELPKDSCAHCRPGGDRPPSKVDNRARLFTASYPGNCAVCGLSFRPGATIERLPEKQGFAGPCCAEVNA